MIALAILALLSAAVVISFRKPLDRVRAFDAIEQIRQIDSSARLASKRIGRPTEISIDMADQSLAWRERGHSADAAFKTTFPSPMRIEEVRTASARRESGEITIECSNLGLSQTYAVKITGGDSPERWVVVTGLAGQIRTVRDEADVDFILAGPTGRHHAD